MLAYAMRGLSGDAPAHIVAAWLCFAHCTGLRFRYCTVVTHRSGRNVTQTEPTPRADAAPHARGRGRTDEFVRDLVSFTRASSKRSHSALAVMPFHVVSIHPTSGAYMATSTAHGVRLLELQAGRAALAKAISPQWSTSALRLSRALCFSPPTQRELFAASGSATRWCSRCDYCKPRH